MVELIKDPIVWFTSAGFVGVCLFGYVAYEIAIFERRRRGYADQEQGIDMDLLEAELSMDLTIINDELASAKRAEMSARLQ